MNGTLMSLGTIVRSSEMGLGAAFCCDRGPLFLEITSKALFLRTAGSDDFAVLISHLM
jgi:hypothetical protein